MRQAIVLVAVALVALSDVSASAAPQPDSSTMAYWQIRGCSHGHSSPHAGRKITAIMKSIEPLTKKRYKRVWHYVVCTNERSGHLKVKERFEDLRKWRISHREWIKEQRLWAYIRANPLPYCTWGPESGGSYTARNPSSTAGGKYQMLDGTFHSYGGINYGGSHDAAQAPPLEQEIVARRLAWTGWGRTPPQGYGAWVRC